MSKALAWLAGFVALTCPSIAMAQTPPPTPSPAAPSPRQPLIISQPDAAIRITKTNDKTTCLTLSTRLSVTNQSDSNVSVALLGASLSAFDNLGFDLLPHSPETYSGPEAIVGGIYVINGTQDNWAQAIQQNKKDFSLLEPGQVMSVIIQATGYVPGVSATANCVADQDGTFYSGHRPKSVLSAGAFVVSFSDNRSEIESFSLPEKDVTLAP